LLVPLVLATLHFQWLYAYLNFREVFMVTHIFFVAPLVVDVLFVVWCLLHWTTVKGYLSGKPCTLPKDTSVLLT